MPCIQPAFYAVFSSHADGPCNMQISGDTPMLLVSQSLPFALRKTRRGAQGNVSSGVAFLMLPSCALFPHCPHRSCPGSFTIISRMFFLQSSAWSSGWSSRMASGISFYLHWPLRFSQALISAYRYASLRILVWFILSSTNL